MNSYSSFPKSDMAGTMQTAKKNPKFQYRNPCLRQSGEKIAIPKMPNAKVPAYLPDRQGF
jgi:hypothetical protein